MPLPPDLSAWVISTLLQGAPVEYRREERDRHLLLAGHLVGGSCSQRATEIQRHASELERNWHLHRQRRPEAGTVRGEVHAARLIGPLPRPRQLRSILGRADWQSRA